MVHLAFCSFFLFFANIQPLPFSIPVLILYDPISVRLVDFREFSCSAQYLFSSLYFVIYQPMSLSSFFVCVLSNKKVSLFANLNRKCKAPVWSHVPITAEASKLRHSRPEPLTSREKNRGRFGGKPDLWLVGLSRTSSFCVGAFAGRVRPLIFHFCPLGSSHVPQDQALNHRVREKAKEDWKARWLPLLSLSPIASLLGRWVVQALLLWAPTRSNSLDYYIYIFGPLWLAPIFLSLDLTPAHAQLRHASVC